VRAFPGDKKGEKLQDVFSVRWMAEVIISGRVHRSEPIVWYGDRKLGEKSKSVSQETVIRLVFTAGVFE